MAKKTSSRGTSRRRSGTRSKGTGKVAKVMGEYKRKTLRSSSGGKVRRRKQAVAIALSEARRSGARIPKKRRSTKS